MSEVIGFLQQSWLLFHSHVFILTKSELQLWSWHHVLTQQLLLTLATRQVGTLIFITVGSRRKLLCTDRCMIDVACANSLIKWSLTIEVCQTLVCCCFRLPKYGNNIHMSCAISSSRVRIRRRYVQEPKVTSSCRGQGSGYDAVPRQARTRVSRRWRDGDGTDCIATDLAWKLRHCTRVSYCNIMFWIVPVMKSCRWNPTRTVQEKIPNTS